MSDILNMGGYGFYVWGAYLVAGIAIVVEVVAVRVRRNSARRAITDYRDAP